MRKFILLKKLQKYRKIKDSWSHLIFETDLEKKLSQRTKFLSGKKKRKKKNNNLQSYTPCLDSQSVKINGICRYWYQNVRISFTILNVRPILKFDVT